MTQQSPALYPTPESPAKHHRQLAFDFATYIIGWQLPYWDGDLLKAQGCRGTMDTFDYNDLQRILFWCSNWCDERDIGFNLGYCTNGDDGWSVDIDGHTGKCWHESPHRALMQTFLAAHQDEVEGKVCQP